MDLLLADKTVVITGAASGIGRASLHAFVAEGARVLAADIDAGALAASVAGLPAGRVRSRVTDVTDPAQVRAMVEDCVSAFGSIDVMFSNAGGAIPTPTEQQDLADYRRIMALNLDAVYYAIHAALSAMLAQGRGCFLSTSSGAGMNAATGLAIYGAAKSGVISLTRSIATEFGGRGIRANAIAPGPMDTPPVRAWLGTFDDGLARFARQVPSGRLGTAEDIARAAVFLASDAAEFINGAVIPVDGAVHARLASPQID